MKSRIKLITIARGRRKKCGLIRSFFTYDYDAKISTCQICRKEVPGDHLGNLTKHVLKHHRAVYDEYEGEEDFDEQDAVPLKKRKITLEYDPTEVENYWLDLVVKEGRPFVILDSKALRTLLSPIFGALEIDMVTSRNVQLKIKMRAQTIVNNITDLLKNLPQN